MAVDASASRAGGSAPGAEVPVLELDLRVPLGSRELEIRFSTGAMTVAIFGPSGGGKSTLLRALAGVEGRARGRVAVMGKRWMDSREGVFVEPWERGVGWVPQDYLLFPHLTVRENLAYGAGRNQDVREIAESLLVDPLLDRRPRRLSGGEQQRVALGRALMSEPRLLLLDEPFSALDRPLRARVVETIRSYLESRRIPLVLVSHDEADAAALGEEHWLLSRGQLERMG